MLKVLIDFDGTLTAEELQARPFAEKCVHTLAERILCTPWQELVEEFDATQERMLRSPHLYSWEVNGQVASYCDEGAFILNTATLQVMLRSNLKHYQIVAHRYLGAQYDPVFECVRQLFHQHTAELPPAFRPSTHDVLTALLSSTDYEPIVMTNSLSNKVQSHLSLLSLPRTVAVLGDTRQYEIDPSWSHYFKHAELGSIQIWPLSQEHRIDLRRPVYYQTLIQCAADRSRLVVVGDTLSLPGAVPLIMGIPFFLLRTSYTPCWCIEAVTAHPFGHVLNDLADLPAALGFINDWVYPSRL